MKFLLTLVLVALICGVVYGKIQMRLTEEQKDYARRIANECIQKEHADEKEVEKLRTDQLVTVNRELTCFANCFLERIGYFVNGVIQTHTILQTLRTAVLPEQLNMVMEQCNKFRGYDNCDTAFQLLNCYRSMHSLSF